MNKIPTFLQDSPAFKGINIMTGEEAEKKRTLPPQPKDEDYRIKADMESVVDGRVTRIRKAKKNMR
jgi:hypothetical protein